MTGQAGWDPEATQVGAAVDEPREGIDVPADGSAHELLVDSWPGDGSTPLHIDAIDQAAADQGDRMRDHDVIGAIRLARVAAADDTSFVRILDRLLTYAAETHPRAIAPTRLLVDAITDEMGRVSVPPPL